MGGLSFLLSFKVTWIKSVKSLSNCVSRLDDSRIEEQYNKCSFSMQDGQPNKQSNLNSLRRLAIQRRNEKRNKNANIRCNIKLMRQEVKIQAENVEIMSENKNAVTFYNPSYQKPFQNTKICDKENIDSASMNIAKGTIVTSSKTFPNILVLIRICGGIFFVICLLLLCITPILIHHKMKPDQPFIYYKPGCPRMNNHTQILKVSKNNHQY